MSQRFLKIFFLVLAGGLLSFRGLHCLKFGVSNVLLSTWKGSAYSKFKSGLYQGKATYRRSGTRLNAMLCYAGLNSTTWPRALRGKQSWEFYPNAKKTGFAMSQDAQEKWRQRFDGWQALAQEHDLHLFVVMAPKSESIYSEYLPERSKHLKASLDRRYEQWIRLLQQGNYPRIHLVELRQAFMQQKENFVLHQPYDFHWSDMGAWVATKQLLQALVQWQPERPDFAAALQAHRLDIYEEEELQKRRKLFKGLDLLKRLWNDVDPTLLPIEGRGYKVSTGDAVGVQFTKAIQPFSDSKMMVRHDSNGQRLKPYLGRLFKEICFSAGQEINRQAMKNRKPEVLVFQTSEPQLQRHD